jgi:hypothetical protein
MFTMLGAAVGVWGGKLERAARRINESNPVVNSFLTEKQENESALPYRVPVGYFLHQIRWQPAHR